MFTRILALWRAPAALEPQQCPGFPSAGAKAAPLPAAQSDLLVRGRMEGFCERGHWPYSTKGLTPHLSRKALLGPAGTWLHPDAWKLLHPIHGKLRERLYTTLEEAPVHSHAVFNHLPVKQIYDAKTHGLKYVATLFAAGSSAKYYFAMDKTRTVCGLLEVRLREKAQGKEARPSTRGVTDPEEFLRQKAILHAVKSILEPGEMGVVDDKGFARVRAMGGDLTRLFPREEERVFVDMNRILDGLGDVHRNPDLILKRAVARGAARELRRWHEAGVMHRDIKLENILWDVGGVIALGDANLAIKAPFYRVEHLVGNALTVAPEVAKARRGDVIGPASDVFSLGMTLLDMYDDLSLFPGRNSFFPEGARRDIAKYEAWRAARSSDKNNPHAPLDWNKILEPSDGESLDRSRDPSFYGELDELARQVAGQCRETAEFVFDRLLRLRPEDRCTAAQADEALDAIDKENRARDEIVFNRILAEYSAADTLRLKLIRNLEKCWDIAASQAVKPTPNAKGKGKEGELTPASAQISAPLR